MKTITSLQNPLVKDAVALHLKKYRDESGLFLVEGEAPCMAAIGYGWDCVTMFVQADSPSPLEGEGRGEGGGTVFVPREILQKISKKDNPQNIIGVFRQRENTSPTKASFYLALEEIRDPGNLGTILRTAHAVGVENIVLIDQCCDPYNPEVIRASMGSFSAVHLSAMSRDEFLDWQQAQGLALIGTDVVDATDYRKADYTNAIVVMGNEQKGLSPALKSHCTARVKIPMPGGTESLNLSIATGLILYQNLR